MLKAVLPFGCVAAFVGDLCCVDLNTLNGIVDNTNGFQRCCCWVTPLQCGLKKVSVLVNCKIGFLYN